MKLMRNLFSIYLWNIVRSCQCFILVLALCITVVTGKLFIIINEPLGITKKQCRESRGKQHQ